MQAALGCPGLPQPAGAGTKGEEGKGAGRRKKGGAEKGGEGKEQEQLKTPLSKLPTPT